MTEQLSPEQRAALCFPDNALCEFMSVHANRVRLSADAVAAIHEAIASAIRAAETAERDRCADCAETVLFFHEVDWEIRQSVGKVIRALPDPTPTTEADNAR